MSKNECLVTSQGFLKLEEELNELKMVKRPQVIEAIKDARAQGDLSENADYDAARNDQAELESRIKELEYMIEHATIIEENDDGFYIGDDKTDYTRLLVLWKPILLKIGFLTSLQLVKRFFIKKLEIL